MKYEDLVTFLLANGWKNCPTMDKIYPEITKELWVKKLDNTPQICLDFTSMLIHSAEVDFVEVSITGEINNNWFTLKSFGGSIEDFVNNHETIEAALIRAWRAL